MKQKKGAKVTSFNLSRVTNALELACSLGFPNILLNIDMAGPVAQTHHLQNQTTADTIIRRPIRETHQVKPSAQPARQDSITSESQGIGITGSSQEVLCTFENIMLLNW
jgi:hypothetical protein